MGSTGFTDLGQGHLRCCTKGSELRERLHKIEIGVAGMYFLFWQPSRCFQEVLLKASKDNAFNAFCSCKLLFKHVGASFRWPRLDKQLEPQTRCILFGGLVYSWWTTNRITMITTRPSEWVGRLSLRPAGSGTCQIQFLSFVSHKLLANSLVSIQLIRQCN